MRRPDAMRAWTILTPEYPPMCGGVGDYTAQVAAALAAAGDEVTVFTPPQPAEQSATPGVAVVTLGDTYGPASRAEIDRRLGDRATTILVQYVPTAFGLKGANIPWCRWLLERSERPGADVRVLFHEPYFDYGWKPLHQGPLSIVQRAMARILLRVGETTYLSTDSWRMRLRRYARDKERRRFVTLPIPSTIPRAADGEAVHRTRQDLQGVRAASAPMLVGHFGTYGTHVAPMLRPALVSLLLEDQTLIAVCAGAGSDAFVRAVVASQPALEGRIRGLGWTPPERTATVLAACDLMLQPFPDGVTTRRTSVMAALNNGRPVLTTTGHLTEPVWKQTCAVVMTAAADGHAFVAEARMLLATPPARRMVALQGELAYRNRFALEHTLAALRGERVSDEGAAVAGRADS
ncbi:MAG TPA: glycosyltransferase [Vicinamibacterales bacterium]|nr:glycosyltransferase [Vicinamibacterales bacterium]